MESEARGKLSKFIFDRDYFDSSSDYDTSRIIHNLEGIKDDIIKEIYCEEDPAPFTLEEINYILDNEDIIEDECKEIRDDTLSAEETERSESAWLDSQRKPM
jgi:hypothetical protein